MTQPPSSFGDRLARAVDAYGRLCVGVDPHPAILDAWGLPESAAGVRELGLRVVAGCAGQAGIVKPQVALYERFAAAGYAALERVLAEARDAGLIIIGDAKRGDIGTSVAGYAAAWLTPGEPLEVDALTVHPYHGLASLQGVFQLAGANGKGAFVLAATSNPEGAAIQRARLTVSSREGDTVAGAIVAGVERWNAEHHAAARLGAIGVVLGATVDFGATGIVTERAPAVPISPVLAPGFGTQGGVITDYRRRFGVFADGVLVAESRSLLADGAGGFADRLARTCDAIAAVA